MKETTPTNTPDQHDPDLLAPLQRTEAELLSLYRWYIAKPVKAYKLAKMEGASHQEWRELIDRARNTKRP